jgi:hypothetical protein
VIDHARSYVRVRVHTNGLENFWSLLKRGAKGTYVCVEPFHLFRYLDEQAFRYNNRATKQRPMNDADRFFLAMNHVAGRRLTYSELTGKGTDALHSQTARARKPQSLALAVFFWLRLWHLKQSLSRVLEGLLRFWAFAISRILLIF